MDPAKFFVLAAFLLGCCMPANAQVNVTVRTTGTVDASAAISGIMPVASGTPYTMEMSSDFPTSAPWISWPDFLNAGDVPFTVMLTANGTTQTISGIGQMNLGMAAVAPGLHLVNYSLSMSVAGTPDRLSFTTVFYLDTQGESMDLIDLFDAGHRYPVDPDADNRNRIMYFGPDFSPLSIHASANSVAYFTTGSPIAVVPEPSHAAMMLAGLALLGAAVRRRRR